MQNVRLKLVIVFFIGVLIFFQYRLWFEPGGLLEMMRLKKAVASQKQENDHLKKRNNALLLQVQRIQQNKDEVESRARRDLGMVKKDEVFYQVVR